VKVKSTDLVRRITVLDPLAASARYDYTDAFAVDLPDPDATPPATWLGFALSRVPAVVDWVAARLGFPPGTGDPLDGWEVRTSGPDVVHLVVDLPLLHVDLLGRNAAPTRRTLTTLLTYRRPWLARLVWVVIGPAHRRTVRWVLATGLRPQPAALPTE
jgi:hypothetical protein